VSVCAKKISGVDMFNNVKVKINQHHVPNKSTDLLKKISLMGIEASSILVVMPMSQLYCCDECKHFSQFQNKTGMSLAFR